MTLRRTIPGTFDPVTGTAGAATVTDYDTYGLLQNIDSKAANQFYGTGALQGSLIQKDDEMVLLSASGLAIAPSGETDNLIIGSDTFSVVSVVPLKPGGVSVMYTLQVRR